MTVPEPGAGQPENPVTEQPEIQPLKTDRAGAELPDAEQTGAPPTWVVGEELEPGDAYMDGPYLVFTAQYHLRRGYCCNSGCRHCPYR